LAQYELGKILGEYEVNKAELDCLISGTDSVQFFGSSKNQMVRPHTKNELLNDGKKNIRIETNEEPTDKKMKNKTAGYCV